MAIDKVLDCNYNWQGVVKLKKRSNGAEARSEVLQIRLSQSEKEMLRASARSAGVSMAGYLLLLAGMPMDSDKSAKAENGPFPGQMRIVGV